MGTLLWIINPCRHGAEGGLNNFIDSGAFLMGMVVGLSFHLVLAWVAGIREETGRQGMLVSE